MKKLELIFLLILLGAAFFVRLYRFSGPIADWHSWRQADTSAVSYYLTKDNFDLLHPMYFDISNVQSGKDNPHGYRMVEFPIYNLLQAGFFTLFKHFTLEEWGRIVTILASVASTLFLYLLGKRFGNKTVGFFAAGFFALVPFSIYYGRTILPDPSMVAATLGAIYFFSLFTQPLAASHKPLVRYFWLVLSCIFMALALLLKPYAIFFSLPIVYLAWNRFGWKLLMHIELWIYAILSVIPLIWWRWWIMHFPEGIPVSDWLFNGGNIRFTGAYFYWIFAERISKLILGYWGLPLVVLGLVSKKKYLGFFLSFLASSLIYVIVIARGNVQHDYYQILILPTIALMFGLGVDMLLSLSNEHVNKFAAYGLVLISCLFLFAFGWYQVRDYFNINNPAIITAGEATQANTPENAKIIAPLGGDTTLLYAAKRQGWPSFEKSLPELVQMGAQYYLIVNPSTDDKNLTKQYKLVASSDNFLLFDLIHRP